MVGNCGVYHFAQWVATGQKEVKDPVLSRYEEAAKVLVD